MPEGTVRRISAGCERLIGLSAVRSSAGRLAIDDIGCDRKDRCRRLGIAVAKIQPLHCFRRIDCRDGNIKAVDQRHFFHFVQGLDLLGQLLPLANDIVCHLAMAAIHEIFLFLPDQKVHAVERDPSVVADNSSAPDSLLQSSRDLNRDMNALNALDGNDGAFPVKRKRHDQNTA